METPRMPQSMFLEDYRTVYEPAEDTFLVLDALENDLEELREHAFTCIECGSGSGAIITALSVALTSERGCNRLMLATDINPDACRTTKKCAAFNNQPGIQSVRTHLMESLVDRLENSTDLLVFNPPYVPTDDLEVVENSEQVQMAWAGGADGRKLTDQFLSNYVPRMMSKPHGKTYLVALHENNIDDLTNYLVKEHNIQGKVVLSRQAGRERLYILKYQWLLKV